MRSAAYGGLTAAVLSMTAVVSVLVSGFRRKIIVISLLGIIAGLPAAALPWSWKQKAARLPAIHDITTDPDNPPAFVRLASLRKRTSNRSGYRSGKLPALQRAAYPDIRPLVIGSPAVKTFADALAAGRSLGWIIVDADQAAGRIEATASTFWFGFKDDVIVRIRPDGNGSRVDVRSASRVGTGDAGTNARRIRRFLGKLHSRSRASTLPAPGIKS